MATINNYSFDFQEVVEALIKQQGINTGLWALAVEFGIKATNIGPDNKNLSPAAIIPIKNIGLIRATELTNLSVDASIVNPATGAKRAKKSS
jgi:hypothetical protein